MQPSQLGFEIRFRLTDGIAEDGAMELWDDFVDGLVAGRGLTCGTGNGHDGAATRLLYRRDASATEDDRRAVREWARRRGEIAEYDIGPLSRLDLPGLPNASGLTA